jgi:hypothetical protein
MRGRFAGAAIESIAAALQRVIAASDVLQHACEDVLAQIDRRCWRGTSTDPSSGTWQRTKITSEQAAGISCPSAALCVVTTYGSGGGALISRDPTGPASTWVQHRSGALGPAIDCPDEDTCVSVWGGNAYTTHNAGDPEPTWTTHIDDTSGGTSTRGSHVDCLTASHCIAVSSAGDGVIASATP